jgi:hypothetical protein
MSLVSQYSTLCVTKIVLGLKGFIHECASWFIKEIMGLMCLRVEVVIVICEYKEDV